MVRPTFITRNFLFCSPIPTRLVDPNGFPRQGFIVSRLAKAITCKSPESEHLRGVAALDRSSGCWTARRRMIRRRTQLGVPEVQPCGSHAGSRRKRPAARHPKDRGQRVWDLNPKLPRKSARFHWRLVFWPAPECQGVCLPLLIAGMVNLLLPVWLISYCRYG